MDIRNSTRLYASVELRCSGRLLTRKSASSGILLPQECPRTKTLKPIPNFLFAFSKMDGFTVVMLEKIKTATVRLPSMGGQGVLVSGDIVLSAAHCVDYSAAGVFGPEILVPMESANGVSMTGRLLAIEELGDVAAICLRDSQNYDSMNDPFEKFVQETPGVKVCWAEIGPKERIPVHILTPKRGWIGGEARSACDGGPFLEIVANEEIEAGASGGPVVNNAGELVGLVSNGTYTDTCHGLTPQICLAFPVWVCQRIREGEASGCDGFAKETPAVEEPFPASARST